MADPIVRVIRDHGERRPSLDVGRRERHGALLRSAGAGRSRKWSSPARRALARRPPASRPRRARRARATARAGALPGHRHREPGRARDALEHRRRCSTCKCASSPRLQPGIATTWLLDGQRRNVNTTSQRVTLPNVFRGTHTLQIVVIDAAGAELMRSASRNLLRAANERAQSELGDRPAAGRRQLAGRA